MAVKLKQKKHTLQQKISRLERVVTQLFVAMSDLEKRTSALDGGIKTKEDETKDK